jgi:hypothetical protein
MLPEAGDKCLIVLDNTDAPWVINWWPERATTTDPGEITPGADGSWLRTAGGVAVWDTIDVATQAELDAEAALRVTHAALTTAAHGGLVANTDTRLTDQRTPSDGSVTTPKIASALSLLGRNISWSIGTTPPATPATGDLWIYNGSGIFWLFVYDNSEATYKWKFVGGPPAFSAVDTSQAIGSAGAWADPATVGPSVTVPRAGDYLAVGTCGAAIVTSASSVQMGIAIGAGTPPAVSQATLPAAGYTVPLVVQHKFVTLSASDELRMRYQRDGNNDTFNTRRLSVLPSRVI